MNPTRDPVPVLQRSARTGPSRPGQRGRLYPTDEPHPGGLDGRDLSEAIALLRGRLETAASGDALARRSDLIRLRTVEGMRVAKAKGRLRGKQPKLNARQEAHLVALHRAGEHSTAELGDLFGVGRSTVYRVIERDAGRRLHSSSRPIARSSR